MQQQCSATSNARRLSHQVGIHHSFMNVPQVLANSSSAHFESLQVTITVVLNAIVQTLGPGSTKWLCQLNTASIQMARTMCNVSLATCESANIMPLSNESLTPKN